MIRPLLILLFLLTLASPALAQCKKRGPEKKLDIFWSAKKQRARLLAEVAAFRPGEVVADIGTADGWFLAVLSAYTDSLTFYLEDIDTTNWNRAAFDSAVHFFAQKNQHTTSHKFHYVQGTERSTGLPHGAFDKVLIINTYHHFSHRDDMLADVVAMLKPGGRIIILEALARKPGDIHHACRKNIFSEEEIIEHMSSKGMHLETSRFIQKIAGRQNKALVFRRT